LGHAFSEKELVYGEFVLIEIRQVLERIPTRTKHRIEPDDVNSLNNLIRLRGELVMPTGKVTAYCGPKDDKFLETALASKAVRIVSGDIDLLHLTSFNEISILRPAKFLARLYIECTNC
jgi:predicted nucleic acid-binding protein